MSLEYVYFRFVCFIPETKRTSTEKFLTLSLIVPLEASSGTPTSSREGGRPQCRHTFPIPVSHLGRGSARVGPRCPTEGRLAISRSSPIASYLPLGPGSLKVRRPGPGSRYPFI